MRAMVLAAGLGVRMRPLSLLRGKPVLPVLNRPLLHWTLEALAREGVRDVLVNLHHLPETVRRAVGDGSAFGLRVTYSLERRVLGTGGGPRRVRAWLGEAPVLLVNGDVVFDFDLEALVADHGRSGARATLALRENPDPRRYGPVVTGLGGRILSLAGRPRPARGTVSLFTGVQVLDPALLDELPTGTSDIVRDLYAPLVARGVLLRGVRVRGAWYDLGSPALYLRSQAEMLASGLVPSATSVLLAPSARVGADVRIEGSVVGAKCVLGDGARVTGSVLWEGVRVGPGARVEGAVVTTGARIPPGRRIRGVCLVPGRLGVGRLSGVPGWRGVPL